VSQATTSKPPADGARGSLPDTYFDALLVVAFGGPEGMDDVMPFLENVTRGRNVPRERLEEVARHYARFGGVSPINAQNRALIAAARPELDAHGIDLPIYLGNRNWHPFLRDTLRQMRDDGVQRALALFTTGFSSYSSCRQYRENILEAQADVGVDAPEVLRLRAFYNHPGFVEANAERVEQALAEVGPGAHVAFTAHSIPLAMASRSRYAVQLAETARLVSERLRIDDYALVYQSRSGPPQVPWLEPDVADHIRALPQRGVSDVVVSPIGFVSDHMEILFDLDVEAREAAEAAGLGFARAQTAGTHPAFVAMIRELVQERLDPEVPRRALGRFGPSHDICISGCCLPS
jgi:protoporphyrin/coproporphyrin ferrochelatase